MHPTAQPLAPLAVSVNDATRLLGIGRTRLYRAFNEGDLKLIKCGKKTLVAYADLQNWLTRLRDPKARMFELPHRSPSQRKSSTKPNTAAASK
jgi:excisionase family DNA binding protein